MVGGGEDEDRLRKRVEELQLKAKVKFLGIRSDVNDLYQAFDFFLFPSLYEGLGIVLVEAQCAGLEVLTSRENIPQEVKLTNHLSFMSLKKVINVGLSLLLNMQNISDIKTFLASLKKGMILLEKQLN